MTTGGPFLWSNVVARAKERPGATAVSASDGAYTYGELDLLSAGLARYLHERGIGPGSRVGVYAPKSRATLAALLGVIRSGAAYVPVDPTVPVRRAAAVLEDAGLAGLVASGSTLRMLRGLQDGPALPSTLVQVPAPGSPETPEAEGHEVQWSAIGEGEAPRVELDREDPVYILYTSGSTGRQKGVVHSHRSARAFVDWAVETFGITADDRLSNHAALTFDLSILDIFAAWSAGAAVYPVPSRIRAFPAAVASWIDENQITLWYSVPSALSGISEARGEARLDSVRTVLFAGDVFPPDRLAACMETFAGARFHNLFGPTETNVCTHFALPESWPPDRDVPIGFVCCGDVAVVDADSDAVEGPGEGELLISGPTVMSGYWRGGTLDVTPLGPPAEGSCHPTYATGDMVRRDGSGPFIFLGRRDGMVKTRGYRVELGEIENALVDHPSIKEAVVVPVPHPEHGSDLVAFVVLSSPSFDEPAVRRSLGERLPRHAVPQRVVPIESIPLTHRGKRDRRGLIARAAEIPMES